MSDYYLPLIFLLILLAVLVQDEYVFTLIYLLLGTFVLARWWSRKALSAVSIERYFTRRVFPGEEVSVRVKLVNRYWLPVVWLQVTESVPVDLKGGEVFRWVLSLGPRASAQFEYVLQAKKRGYYQVGPLYIRSGDVLGLLGQTTSEGEHDPLIVYPRVMSLKKVKFPSSSPLGTIRHTQPIFEDPTRVVGKRDYVAGDSLRRVDWKSTAMTGRLQVKQHEPSIALETVILLNLNRDAYRHRRRIEATELAIVVAASIANWVVGQKQPVGLISNGVDPAAESAQVNPIRPRLGRGQLMRVLEILARIKVDENTPLVQLLQQEQVHLSWGTTLVLITGDADEGLFDELFQALRMGLNVVLILCGLVGGIQGIRHRASYFGIPVYHFQNERDLEIWR